MEVVDIGKTKRIKAIIQQQNKKTATPRYKKDNRQLRGNYRNNRKIENTGTNPTAISGNPMVVVIAVVAVLDRLILMLFS